MTIIQSLKGLGIHRDLVDKLPEGVKDSAKELLYEASTLAQYGRRDMFTSVAVETTSICNRRCSYCPVSDDGLRKQRPLKEMDEGLYSKIVGDLADIDYQGTLALQHYGEPLLDSKLTKRIEIAKRSVPKAHILIRSNGDMLTPERLEELVDAGVDEVFVTNHNTDGTLSPTLMATKDYVTQHPELSSYLTVREGLQAVYNRGGLVEVNDKPVIAPKKCIAESHTLTVDVEGKVVLCSNDYLAQHSFGNATKKSLMEIWDSSRFKEIRRRKKKGKLELDICKKCVGE